MIFWTIAICLEIVQLERKRVNTRKYRIKDKENAQVSVCECEQERANGEDNGSWLSLFFGWSEVPLKAEQLVNNVNNF